MKVEDIVKKRKVITIDGGATLEIAFQLMVANRIRHLPVLRKGKLVGIVSDRDLKGALILNRHGEPGKGTYFIPPGVRVAEVMTADPVVASPETDVQDAARTMHVQKIGCLPVVHNQRTVGIVTESDILGIFIEMMGVIESSSRVDVELDGSRNGLDRAAEAIRAGRGRILSVAMSPPRRGGRRIYYFRLASCDTDPIVASLSKAGFKVRSAVS